MNCMSYNFFLLILLRSVHNTHLNSFHLISYELNYWTVLNWIELNWTELNRFVPQDFSIKEWNLFSLVHFRWDEMRWVTWTLLYVSCWTRFLDFPLSKFCHHSAKSTVKCVLKLGVHAIHASPYVIIIVHRSVIKQIDDASYREFQFWNLKTSL